MRAVRGKRKLSVISFKFRSSEKKKTRLTQRAQRTQGSQRRETQEHRQECLCHRLRGEEKGGEEKGGEEGWELDRRGEWDWTKER